MAAFVADRDQGRGGVAVRRMGGHCLITIDSKERAVALRKALARRGVRCSFPVPTWQQGRYEFRAHCPDGMLDADLERLAYELIELRDPDD